MANDNSVMVRHLAGDFSIGDLGHRLWLEGEEFDIGRYWSGAGAPRSRHTAVVMLWSDSALYVKFSANQFEPLNTNEKPNLAEKTNGLWNRDVCELFIGPPGDARGDYFEFEVAPTGEWLDLAIHYKEEERETDWDFDSGVEAAAGIETNKVTMAIKIPWSSLGKPPKPGDCWRGNLFRIVGNSESRGFLAWQPTETEIPDFHVPAKFGRFCLAAPDSDPPKGSLV